LYCGRGVVMDVGSSVTRLREIAESAAGGVHRGAVLGVWFLTRACAALNPWLIFQHPFGVTQAVSRQKLCRCALLYHRERVESKIARRPHGPWAGT
jgi:hypothetical protein